MRSPRVGATASMRPASPADWPVTRRFFSSRRRVAIGSRRASCRSSVARLPSNRCGSTGPRLAPGEAAENDDQATTAAAAPRAVALPGPIQLTTGTEESRTARIRSSGSVSRAPMESIWRMTTLAPLVCARRIDPLMRSATTGSIAPSTWTTSMWRSAPLATVPPAAAAGAHGRVTQSSVKKAKSGRRSGVLLA